MTISQATRIIERFRTQECLADALGCRQSVIAGWKRRGFIPAPQQARVLDAAKRLGIALEPSDFFETENGGEPSPLHAEQASGIPHTDHPRRVAS